MVAAVLVEDDKVLAAKRGPTMRMAGLWEFPGGKVEAGEQDQQALKRELVEELGISVSVGDAVATVVHPYETFEIELVAYRCGGRSADLTPVEHEDLRWLDAASLRSVTWAPADIALLDAVEALLT